MHPLPLAAFAFWLLAFLALSVEAATQPDGVSEYVSREQRIAISFPRDWTLKPSTRNEVWLAAGELRSVPVGCFVRISTVPNLHLLKPDDYFARADEKAFMKLNSIGMPDVKVHLYDFSFLGGRKARRIIYSGTDDGTKVGNLVHQTLDGDRIITVICFTQQHRFQLIYPEMETITDSFRFLK